MGAILLKDESTDASYFQGVSHTKTQLPEPGISRLPQRTSALAGECKGLGARWARLRELLSPLARRLHLWPRRMEHHVPRRSTRKKLQYVPFLLAESPRPCIGLFHFRRRKALGGDRRRAEKRSPGPARAGALGGVWQRPSNPNPSLRCADRFDVANAGPLCGPPASSGRGLLRGSHLV